MNEIKEINVSSLVLEVTKRCNQQCEHCLRGHARNVNMTPDIIDKVLSQVSYISSVTFTGGEPTLNLPLIEYFFKRVEELNIGISAFWLATNGLDMENQLKLCSILLRYFHMMEEPDMCGVALSVDDFHEKTESPSPVRYLSFYDSSKEHESDPTGRWIINKGLADENGIGSVARDFTQDFYVDVYGPGSVNVDLLYVDALGRLYADCDMTYEEQDESSLGTVESIVEAITPFVPEEKETDSVA